MTKSNRPLALADANGHVWTRGTPLADKQTLLDSIKRHRDGYLIADARVARVGLQSYRGYEVGKPDKDRVTLYRPPEEVFSTDSMRSHANKPVTMTHPKKMVDADTWTKVAKGMSGGEVVRDGDYVRVPLMLTDAATIKAFESGDARELSVGYTTDIDWSPGVLPDGQTYDGIQRDIRTNHHALVPAARGGPDLRLGDAAGRYCQDCGARVTKDATTCQDCGVTLKDDDEGMMDAQEMLPADWQTTAADSGNIRSMEMAVVTKTFDGVPVNFADEQSAALVAREISKMQRAVADAEAKMKKMADDDAEEEQEEEKKLRAQDAAIKMKDGEIAVLKDQLAKQQITDADLDARIAERAAVLDAAKPHLPQGFTPAGKSVPEIRRTAVVTSLGDAAVKDWDDATIRGAFEALTRSSAKHSGARTMADGLSSGMRASDPPTLSTPSRGASLQDSMLEAEKAHAEYVANMTSAYKKPLLHS